MIHVPRPTAGPPALIAAAAKEMEAYKEFLKTLSKQKAPAKKNGRVKYRSEGFKFEAYRLEAVKEALEKTFHFKCAYCDSEYSAVENVRVEHFRPKGRVDREGLKPIQGYYWLAAEWSNLLPSCERCNSPKKDFIPALNRKETVGKANWFPLWDEKKRATKPGYEKGEYPLLLNPCEEDTERYLVFNEDGMVEPAPGLGKRARAKAEKSIRLYGLGRLMLVKARHEHAKRVLSQIKRVVENYDDWRAARRNPERCGRLLWEWDELGRFLLPDAPYHGLVKQLMSKVSVPMRKDIERLSRTK
ncbi:MAG TPA: retron system putative HNH endonuclease [Thermoanaerobaculia bacterium]|nr:retron system putative HNH endonuclease [Thermoanaerobaculia bacterium]